MLLEPCNRHRAIEDPEKEGLVEKPLRILMLEDNPADAELVTYQLKKGGLEFVSKRVEKEADFRRELTDFEPDILLLDFELPTFDGLSALLAARSIAPDVPAIFVTGVMGEDSAVDMLHQGATDYVLKDNLSRLVPAVERALSEAEELAKLKAAEEALRQGELKYSQMFQNIHSGVAVYRARDNGEDFIFVDFNKAAERIDGISREEVVGKSVLEVFPGIRGFGLFEVFQRVWRTGVPERHPEGHYSDDRISGWRDNYLYRLPSAELVVVYEDISERKMMEESLRASQERLATSQEVGRLGSWEYDVDSHEIQWSLQTFRLYERDPALGPPGEEEEARYYSEEQARILRGYAARAIAEGNELEYDFEVLLPSGRQAYYSAMLRPFKDGSGRVTLLRGTVQDITERKQAELERAALSRRLKAILDSAREGILTLDMQRVITSVNPAAEGILGYTEEELVGQSMEVLYASREAFDEMGQRFYPVILEKGSVRDELEVIRSDGTLIPTEATVALLAEEDEPVGIVTVFRDTSDRKRMEERQGFTARLLSLLNERIGTEDTIRQLLEAIKDFTGIEAAGIRLAEGDDYPYFQTNGFPGSFVEAETHLCARDENGEVLRDPEGNPFLDCMCGNVIQGRTDPNLPFFTERGSFWTNSTSGLLASTTEADREAPIRNRFAGEGYESVALIPLRSENRVIGLLQLNDRRRDMFDIDAVLYFEGIADSIGIAVDRKNTVGALRRREEELQQLVDKMINAFVLFESVFDESSAFVSYRFVYINEAYERITGVKNEEVRGKTVHEVWPATEPEWIKRYGEVAVTGVSQTFDLYHDPTAKLYHCTVYRPWETDDRFCVVFEDITEREAAESAAGLLAELAVRFINVHSEDLGSQTERTLQDIAALAGADRCFLHLGTYETEAIEQAYEWHRPELKSRARDLIGLDLRPMAWLIPMLESSRTIRFTSPDDLPQEAELERSAWRSVGIVSLLAVPLIPEGTLTGLLGLTSEKGPRVWSDAEENMLRQAANLLSNVLARTRAEEALRASEAYYQALLEQSIDCITVLDETGTIRYESPSVTALLGYEPDELLGMNVFDYVHPDDIPAAVEAFSKGLGSPVGSSAYMEVRFKHKDGTWRWFGGVGWNMLNDPVVSGVILNSREITGPGPAPSDEDGLR